MMAAATQVPDSRRLPTSLPPTDAIKGKPDQQLACKFGEFDVGFGAGFSDVGVRVSTLGSVRRPKSAQARNRGRWAPLVQLALWGFEAGADGGCDARIRPQRPQRLDGMVAIDLATVSTLRFG